MEKQDNKGTKTGDQYRKALQKGWGLKRDLEKGYLAIAWKNTWVLEVLLYTLA